MYKWEGWGGAMGLFHEFRQFTMRGGSAIDMGVGVVLGGLH
ncbi:MscL family protein [Gracilibacillus boraciitolerans]|nr:MscL family protein [Gracilibacillus boraciitolerans]